MKISELTDNMEVTARLGRAGRTRVEWEPPANGQTPNQDGWQRVVLYVQKCPKGNLQVITTRSVDWAEASMRDFSPDPEGGIFQVEDYYLQIMDLEP